MELKPLMSTGPQEHVAVEPEVGYNARLLRRGQCVENVNAAGSLKRAKWEVVLEMQKRVRHNVKDKKYAEA